MLKRKLLMKRVALYALLILASILLMSGCGSAQGRPHSVWDVLGIDRNDIVCVEIAYNGHSVNLCEDYFTRLLDALGSAEPKEITDPHIYDVSEYSLTFHTEKTAVTPYFCWFSGRAIGEEPDYFVNRIRDTRFDLSLDGESYYHFEHTDPAHFWDEYDSRRGYDKSAKALGLPQRGNWDGMDEWYPFEGTTSMGTQLYKKWEDLADDCSLIAIAEYVGRIDSYDERSSYPYPIRPDVFIATTYLKGEPVSRLKNTSELSYLFHFHNHTVDMFSELVHSPYPALGFLPDSERTPVINGVYLPVSYPQYRKGQQYLVFASDYMPEETQRKQFVYAAYPIEDGMIYPWYNTELELFNAFPLEEVTAYLSNQQSY